MNIFEFTGTDFQRLTSFDGWAIGFVRYGERFSKLGELERHMETDEAFVLLEGSGTLYEQDEDGNLNEFPMEKCRVYMVTKGVWHHVTVSHDATIMVVENSNTSKANSEKKVIVV